MILITERVPEGHLSLPRYAGPRLGRGRWLSPATARIRLPPGATP